MLNTFYKEYNRSYKAPLVDSRSKRFWKDLKKLELEVIGLEKILKSV